MIPSTPIATRAVHSSGTFAVQGMTRMPLAWSCATWIRWRRQRAQGELAGLEPKRRAAPSPESRAQTAELARLQRENQRLQAKLAQAEVIIDVQKKLATLLGIVLPDPPSTAQE